MSGATRRVAADAGAGESGGAFRARTGPLETELLLRGSALAQVKVYESLIRNGGTLGEDLEVPDGLFVQTDRDLLLQTLGVGIGACAREVVVLSHRILLLL